MANVGPAFQFYARDFYVGTSHFSSAEVGVYTRGLAWSWDNGPLPAEDSRLARVLLIDLKEFRKVWPTVSEKWHLGEHGYTNHRLEEVRQEQAEYKEGRSASGRAGARARWGGQDGKRNGTANGERIAQPSSQQCREVWRNDGPPPPPPSPEDQKQKTPRTKRAEPAEGFDAFWVAYPLKTAKADAIKAWNKLAPSESLREFIGAALIWQRPMLTFEKDGQVKGTYPASWLNGRRWEDERPAVVRSDLPTPQPRAPFDEAIESLCVRCDPPISRYNQHQWLTGATLTGDVLTVTSPLAHEWVSKHYLARLEQAHGRPLTVVLASQKVSA